MQKKVFFVALWTLKKKRFIGRSKLEEENFGMKTDAIDFLVEKLGNHFGLKEIFLIHRVGFLIFF